MSSPTLAPPAEAALDAHPASQLRLLATVIAHDNGPFEDRLQRALSLATTLLGYDIGLMSRIEGDTYTVVASHAPEVDIEPGTEFELGDTYCSITLGVDDLLEIQHTERSAHRAHPCYGAFGLESYLGVPIRAGGRTWGTLSFSSPEPHPTPLTEADHDLVRLLAIWVGGVVEERSQSDALAVQREQMQAVLDHAPLVLFGIGTDGQFTLSEGAGLRNLGLEPGEIVGQDAFALYGDVPNVKDALQAVLDGETRTWESVVGDAHYVNRARPTHDSDGGVTGLIGVSFDVTVQRRAQSEARANLDRFEALTTSAVDAILTTDAAGTITSWNAAAERVFGHGTSEAVGKPITLLLPEEEQQKVLHGFAHVLEIGHHALLDGTSRLQLVRTSGESFPADVSFSAWGKGSEIQFASIIRDVSEQVAREQAHAESEERFRALSDATFEGIAFTEGGVITDANEQFAWLFGYAFVEDVVGRRATEFCAPEHEAKVGEMLRSDRVASYEAVCVRRDGSRFWAEFQGRSAPVEGRTVRITAVRDVSVRKRTEEQRRFQANVLGHVSDAVVALDLEGRITYWNAGAELLHGHAASDVLGRRLDEVVQYLVPEHGGTGALEVTHAPEAALQSTAAENGELIYVGPDGERRFVSVSSSTIRSEDGDERGLLAVARDVTAQRQFAARLRHQASHDALTGLPNRTLLRARIEEALGKGVPFAVLFVDLDHFKVVNDSLGHDAGDHLLTTIAHRLRESLGATEGAIVARLGGDEFGIFVPTAAADPVEVGREVLAALDSPVDLGVRAVTPSASVGVVPASDEYATPDDLLRDADTAMYAAKREGRQRLSVFAPAMHEAATLRFQLEQDLRQAVARDQLRFELQPIVRLSDGTIAGFEALVRWEHPEHGLLSPGQFLPLARETGCILDVDRWTIETACRTASGWIEAAGLRLHLNCSQATFLDPTLPGRLRTSAESAGVPLQTIVLELNEGVFSNLETALGAAGALRAEGALLAIDNFGVGHSALGLIHSLPLNGLKIDRSFVAEVDESAAARAVVRSVIQLADVLDLATIAEGALTPDHVRTLRAEGVPLAQGHLFSMPVAPDQARAMLDDTPWAQQWADWA